jgi:hypothetical protein
MAQDFSWERAAADYEQLYRDAYARRRKHPFPAETISGLRPGGFGPGLDRDRSSSMRYKDKVVVVTVAARASGPGA